MAPNTPTPPTTCRRHVTPFPRTKHGPSMVPKQPPRASAALGMPKVPLYGLGGYRDNRLARLGAFRDVLPFLSLTLFTMKHREMGCISRKKYVFPHFSLKREALLAYVLFFHFSLP